VSTSGSPAATAQTANPGVPGSPPQFKHVYLLVLENEEYGSLVGSGNAPFLNGLIAKYGLATNYFGVAHPSQPNYLALFSGSTQGVTDDGNHDISAANLADQLETAHKTWSVFAQDYPGGCFAGASQSGGGEGIGAAGSYARKHDPAISFTDISSNPSRCSRISNLAAFDPAAADFELIVPNQCNDMHSCPIATGDAFLRTFVPRITSSPAFAGSVLFITTDEGTTNANGGGQVATIVVSPLAKNGFSSAVRHDHYSLLRTIEDSWGLPCLGQACSATDMAEFFR
jgi:acid phosphatase